MRPRWCGVFRVEVRESENRAHPPSHPHGCLCSRPGNVAQRRHHDLVRSARRRRRAGAAADSGSPGRGPVDRESAHHAGHHRRRHTRYPRPLRHGAGGDRPRSHRDRFDRRPGRAVVPEGERGDVHHEAGERRSRAVGESHSGRARPGRQSVQLRRHQSGGAPAGHRADQWSQRGPVRHRRPGCRLQRRDGRSGAGTGCAGRGRCQGRYRVPHVARGPAVHRRWLDRSGQRQHSV